MLLFQMYTSVQFHIASKQADVISLTNKATLDHHFRALPRKALKRVCPTKRTPGLYELIKFGSWAYLT